MLSLSHTQNALHPRGIAQLLSCLVDLESHGDLFSMLQILPLSVISDFNHIWTCFNGVISSKSLLDTVYAVSCLQGSTLPLLNKIGLLTVITGQQVEQRCTYEKMYL